jgi:membrane-associated phospholipid phosphatase
VKTESHRQRPSKISRFVRARLSSEDVLGIHLTLGILVLIGATWLFAIIAEDVINQEQLSRLDVELSNAIHARDTRSLTLVLLVVTNVHSTVGVGLIALAVTVYLWRRRLKDWALAFALSVYGGMLLNAILKHIFQRSRPHLPGSVLTFKGYSFPSGHTIMATTLYGALCALLISRVRGWLWRGVIIVGAIFLIVLVGFSRIYLGAHYLSDVLAAMVEGLFWLAVCLTGVFTMRRWKEQKHTHANTHKR